MAHRSRTQEEHKTRAHEVLKAAGAPIKHGDAAQDKTLIKSELKKHVKASDLVALARGGAAKPKAKSVTVNVVHGDEQAAQQRGVQQGMQQGVKVGAMMASRGAPGAGAPPPRPPMAGAPMPPGAPPPGGGGIMPPRPPMAPPMTPGGMKDGGGVRVREHFRAKRGGACK